MADLVSHWALAVLVKDRLGGRDVPVFVAGSLLPDLLARLPPLALERLTRGWLEVPPLLSYAWAPFHLPVGMLGASYALALLFPVARRRAALANLLGGMALHLGVDLLQDHLGIGYQLLFPWWGRPVELGIVGSEDSVLVAPLLAALALWVTWRRRRARAAP